jgi:hypothetical protein
LTAAVGAQNDTKPARAKAKMFEPSPREIDFLPRSPVVIEKSERIGQSRFGRALFGTRSVA